MGDHWDGTEEIWVDGKVDDHYGDEVDETQVAGGGWVDDYRRGEEDGTEEIWISVGEIQVYGVGGVDDH